MASALRGNHVAVLIPPGTRLPAHPLLISPLRTRSGQAEFRFFYNHVRPHQNLYGSTPAEAWVGIDPFADSPKEYWFEAWDGLLKGYYLRR